MNTENIFIKQMAVGPMMNYSYLIGDKVTKEMAVVDPGWDAEKIMQEAKSAGFELKYILATHTHFDHIHDISKIISALNVTTIVHEAEAGALEGEGNIKTVSDGDMFNVGGLELKAIHTPGHTKGSICYLLDSALFTGDTLFIDGIGRTDLEGGDTEEMFASMRKLASLSDNIIIYPGHNYGPQPTSTIGEQKKTNVYLTCRNISDFLRIA